MFGGVHQLSIDSKGRLAIPAKFRDLLARYYTPALVVTIESRERLLLYPESEWERVSRELLALRTAGNPALQKFQNLLLHNAELLEFDSAGRVLLPANLRKRVTFDKDVTLVSRGNRLEIWDRADWEAQTEEALDMDREELDDALSQVDLQL